MRIALLFAFLGSVYVVFLVCHFVIPGRLADQLFSAEHEQRTLLVGPVEKAREFSRWILETKAFGFGLRVNLVKTTKRKDPCSTSRVSRIAQCFSVLFDTRASGKSFFWNFPLIREGSTRSRMSHDRPGFAC